MRRGEYERQRCRRGRRRSRRAPPPLTHRASASQALLFDSLQRAPALHDWLRVARYRSGAAPSPRYLMDALAAQPGLATSPPSLVEALDDDALRADLLRCSVCRASLRPSAAAQRSS